MNDETYKIILADGTEISNLTMNGNNYISDTAIDSTVFENNCSPVTIVCGENEEAHSAMDLIHVTQMSGKYWFALRDVSAAELAEIKIRSDIDYIALMCDVEL